MSRKLYRRVFTIELLSDEPILDDAVGLPGCAYDGPCSGKVDYTDLEEVEPARMAKLLQAQGSDPGFLGLADDGRWADEVEEDEEGEED